MVAGLLNDNMPELAIARWAAWMPGRDTVAAWRECAPLAAVAPDYPACRFVDAGARRRLTPLARIALQLAHDVAADLPAVRVVFASRHGEINRTHLLLQDIAADEAVSPTVFGLSVHNAVAGMLSLLRQDVSACTAIAAGEATLAHGLLQAAVDAAAEPSPLLLLYADLPLLPFYAGADDALTQPLGLALLLQPGAPQWRLQQDAAAHAVPGWPQAAQLAQALACGWHDIALDGWRLRRAGA